MSALEKPFFTPGEYLDRERKADLKSEDYAGQIFAMSGGTSPHSIISGNVLALLWTQLRRKACTVFNSDMKVKVSPTGLFTYSDVSVVCGEVKFHDGTRDVIENPLLIVEVLSPSAQGYDRGEKFLHYQSLDTLKDYVLISQDVMRAEHFVRQGDNQWLLSVCLGPDAVVKVASVDCELRLSEIYEKTDITLQSNPPTLHRS